ncbi:hypothetical protein NBRC116494_10600 [Aurantivibrio plasticivorans]
MRLNALKRWARKSAAQQRKLLRQLGKVGKELGEIVADRATEVSRTARDTTKIMADDDDENKWLQALYVHIN